MVDLTTVAFAFAAAAAAASAEPTTFQSALHGARRTRMNSIPSRQDIQSGSVCKFMGLYKLLLL